MDAELLLVLLTVQVLAPCDGMVLIEVYGRADGFEVMHVIALKCAHAGESPHTQ
jgi:hypothetical protein